MKKFQETLDYRFDDEKLLELALSHPSLSGRKEGNNQRLEFLGDAVLGLCVAELLYKMYPDEAEGPLAKRQAALICGEQLSKIAKDIGLDKKLLLSTGEEDLGGRENKSNLEDACEALIGAIYLDAGLGAAREFIMRYWEKPAREMQEAPKDPKTALQEWAQGKGLPLPLYEVVAQSGPSHAPNFTVQVSVEGLEPAKAEASSKKAAEREAANLLLESIALQ